MSHRKLSDALAVSDNHGRRVHYQEIGTFARESLEAGIELFWNFYRNRSEVDSEACKCLLRVLESQRRPRIGRDPHDSDAQELWKHALAIHPAAFTQARYEAFPISRDLRCRWRIRTEYANDRGALRGLTIGWGHYDRHSAQDNHGHHRDTRKPSGP